MTGGEREGESGRGGVKIGAKEEPMLFNGKETQIFGEYFFIYCRLI